MENKPKSLFPFLLLILILSLLAISIILFWTSAKCSIPLLQPAILGQLGDFYGGIIGTIITFVGLYFIYHTYNQQKEQLDVAKKDSDLEIINKLYSDLLQDINSIQYRRIKKNDRAEIIDEELFQGLDALYNFDENHSHSPNSVLNHVTSILLSFDHILMMANKIKYKYQDMKNIMLTKIYFLYYSKILWPVAQEIYSKRRFELFATEHSDSKFLFDRYEKLTAETYKFLLDNKHIGYPHKDNTLIVELLKKRNILDKSK